VGAAVGAAVAAAPALAPLLAPPALSRPSPFAAAPPPAASAARPAVPVVVFRPFIPPSGSTSTATAPKPIDPTVGQLKPWTPPAPSTTTAVAVAASTAAPAAIAASSVAVAAPPAAPPAPKPVVVVVDADAYAKFVDEGPYSSESKLLLKLIGAKAPSYCLPLLRRTVTTAVPQIVLEGAKTGSNLRAGTLDAAGPDSPPIVALSPGPVFIERRTGFLFGRREAVLLPESPAVWSELGVPAPALTALTAEPPPVEPVNGPWGATRTYADGSARGTYSPQEQAGELLEQLLLIGLRREGFAASEYAARVWARTARLMFSEKIKEDFGDAFLDLDRRAELADWLVRPAELDDDLFAAWSSARRPVIDPRRGPPDGARDFDAANRPLCARTALEDALVESARRRARTVGLLEGLLDAGLVDAAAAKSAAQAAADADAATRQRLVSHPPACPAPDPARPEGLRKSALLLAEARRAESELRQRLQEGGQHASR